MIPDRRVPPEMVSAEPTASPTPLRPVSSDAVPACTSAEIPTPTGTTRIIPVQGDPIGDGPAQRLRIEVENGLPVDAICFATAVMAILTDPRGWTADATVAFQQVDSGPYDYRLILASPTTVDRLCAPLRTAGKYSCHQDDRVMLNYARWDGGGATFAGDIDTYRRYLVNHEIGHAIGRRHRPCPTAGAPAPVMMQQTKTVGSCRPNGWPTLEEF